MPYRVAFWTTRMSKNKTPMTIGIFNEHAFLEKAIGTYACAHRGAHARVMWNGVQTEKPKLNAQVIRFSHQSSFCLSVLSFQKVGLGKKLVVGSNTSQGGVESTYTIILADMEASMLLPCIQLMVITRKVKPCSNTAAVIFMVVQRVILCVKKESLSFVNRNSRGGWLI